MFLFYLLLKPPGLILSIITVVMQNFIVGKLYYIVICYYLLYTLPV